MIASGHKPALVKVMPEPWAKERECFPNVQRKVSEKGGRRIYGWVLWQCGHLFIEAENHAIYETPEKQWMDITPQVPAVSEVVFLPDERATYNYRTMTTRDNKRLALIKDARVNKMLKLFAERSALVGSAPRLGNTVSLTGNKRETYRRIENELARLRDDLCG